MDGRAVQLLLRARARRSSTSTSTRSRSRPRAQKRVDFSTPYYTAPQAVRGPKGSHARRARRSLADLKDAKIGVQIGTTSLDAVNDVIKPGKQPQVFNDSNDVVRALKTEPGRRDRRRPADGLLPTAAQVAGSKIVGQFAAPGGDNWGVLLQKGSEADAVRDAAIGRLAARGELKRSAEVDGRRGGRAGAAAERLPAATAAGAPSARPRGGAGAPRDAAIAAISTVVVLGGLAALIVTSPGWPERRRARSSTGSDFKDSFPDVLRGFWLDVKLFMVVEVVVLVAGPGGGAGAAARRAPALFPLRLLAAVFTDVFRGVPVMLVVYLIGFGVPALELRGLPTDPVVLGGSRWRSATRAYVAEVYRAGHRLDPPQPARRPRSRSGLTRGQAMRYVVLPRPCAGWSRRC